ncbi:unnamed protein product [Diamesa serratosioi]
MLTMEMIKNDPDWECIFCSQSDVTMLFEISSNSLLIQYQLIDFTDIFKELGFQLNESFQNHICDHCKDQLSSLYILKQQAKTNPRLQKIPNLSVSSKQIIEEVEQFLLSCEDQNIYIIQTDSEFTISIKDNTVTDSIQDKNEYEEIDEVSEQYQNENVVYLEKNRRNEIQPESTNDKQIRKPNSTKTVQSITKVEFDNESTTEPPALQLSPSKHNKKVYICECTAQFESIVGLQEHTSEYKRSSCVQGAFTCCGVWFKDGKLFNSHKKIHESFEIMSPFLKFHKCQDCNITFSNEIDYVSHLNEQLCNTGATIQPMAKDGSFEDYYIKPIVFELDEELDAEDAFKCGHCMKRFNDENELKIHVMFFHATTLNCPFDRRSFDGVKQVRLLHDHVRNKHPELFVGIIFSCRYCHSSFPSNIEKLAHMKKCNDKKYDCPHCDKKYASPWLLERHLKHVNGKISFICTVCEKSCYSRSDLAIHLRTHNNEKPYSCTICMKAFKTSTNRSSHMDVHKSEKVHECNVCGQKFQTRPVLRKHKKKHDKVYQDSCICKICQKTYISRPHLARHMKAHGGEENLSSAQIDDFYEAYFDGLKH